MHNVIVKYLISSKAFATETKSVITLICVMDYIDNRKVSMISTKVPIFSSPSLQNTRPRRRGWIHIQGVKTGRFRGGVGWVEMSGPYKNIITSLFKVSLCVGSGVEMSGLGVEMGKWRLVSLG